MNPFLTPAVGLNVLMYHSISNGTGPTSISAETFRIQIQALASCGYQTVSLDEFRAWHAGNLELPAKSIMITFDDGFVDFAECAFPVLKDHNYTATVFLVSGMVGKTDEWEGADRKSRRLMTWSQVADLARNNIDIGGHGVTHCELTKLSSVELEREIRQCRDDIERRLGRPVPAFAPPYGRAGHREHEEIRKRFDLSVGTRLDRAVRKCGRFEIPRIEMHYFRDIARWRAYLEGSADWYLAGRQAMRAVRSLVSN
jgi:peptidoglycan/xylan/chitin deacetylase (PgdA/CDA1 family)